jgi:hypothetical protein
MLEIGTSGLMSGEGKRASVLRLYRASPRLYMLLKTKQRTKSANCLSAYMLKLNSVRVPYKSVPLAADSPQIPPQPPQISVSPSRHGSARTK